MANGYKHPPVMNIRAHLAYMEALAELLLGMEGRNDKQNIDAAILFRRAFGLACPDTADPHDYLVALHRQRYRSRLVKPEHIGYSGKWLVERGYSLEHDKVFAPVKLKGPAP